MLELLKRRLCRNPRNIFRNPRPMGPRFFRVDVIPLYISSVNLTNLLPIKERSFIWKSVAVLMSLKESSTGTLLVKSVPLWRLPLSSHSHYWARCQTPPFACLAMYEQVAAFVEMCGDHMSWEGSHWPLTPNKMGLVNNLIVLFQQGTQSPQFLLLCLYSPHCLQFHLG